MYRAHTARKFAGFSIEAAVRGNELKQDQKHLLREQR